MGRIAAAEAKKILARDEFPFFIQLIGDGDVPGTVEISVWTGQGALAKRYFKENPIRVDGVEVPVIVIFEGQIIPA